MGRAEYLLNWENLKEINQQQHAARGPGDGADPVGDHKSPEMAR